LAYSTVLGACPELVEGASCYWLCFTNTILIRSLGRARDGPARADRLGLFFQLLRPRPMLAPVITAEAGIQNFRSRASSFRAEPGDWLCFSARYFGVFSPNPFTANRLRQSNRLPDWLCFANAVDVRSSHFAPWGQAQSVAAARGLYPFWVRLGLFFQLPLFRA